MATKKTTEPKLTTEPASVNGEVSLLEHVKAEIAGLEKQRDQLQAQLHQTIGALTYAEATLKRLEA